MNAEGTVRFTQVGTPPVANIRAKDRRPESARHDAGSWGGSTRFPYRLTSRPRQYLTFPDRRRLGGRRATSARTRGGACEPGIAAEWASG